MTSSSSNLVNNLAEEIHRIKCKFGHDDKKCETCEIKCKYSNFFLEYTNFRVNNFLRCNKNYQHKFDEMLKKRIFTTYKFSIHNNNKFSILLWKGVYPYEYMNDWKKFNETSLLEKEVFFSDLSMEDITYAYYAHGKRVCKDFEIKNLGTCHDLYVQRDTLLLADVFENFRNMCLEIYELDPTKFLLARGLAWQAALKKIKVKLNLLTDKEYVKRKGICHYIYRYAKGNSKYMKDYDKNEESP